MSFAEPTGLNSNEFDMPTNEKEVKEVPAISKVPEAFKEVKVEVKPEEIVENKVPEEIIENKVPELI